MNVWVTSHAAERFQERVRPGMDRLAASKELARLLATFGRRVEQPVWLEVVLREPRYLVEVSDGVLAVCEPPPGAGMWPRAVTVITRSTCTPEVRERRNRRRASRRSAKQVKSRLGLGGRPRAVGDFETH